MAKDRRYLKDEEKAVDYLETSKLEEWQGN